MLAVAMPRGYNYMETTKQLRPKGFIELRHLRFGALRPSGLGVHIRQITRSHDTTIKC